MKAVRAANAPKTACERGYDRRWRAARESFLGANPLCVRCEAAGLVTEATVVDHIVPHRGDAGRFWDRTNWQSLCTHHHSVKTATEDRYVVTPPPDPRAGAVPLLPSGDEPF